MPWHVCACLNLLPIRCYLFGSDGKYTQIHSKILSHVKVVVGGNNVLNIYRVVPCVWCVPARSVRTFIIQLLSGICVM